MTKHGLRVKLNCHNCHNIILLKSYEAKSRKYCSSLCYNQHVKGTPRILTKEHIKNLRIAASKRKGKPNPKLSEALKNSPRARKFWFKRGKLNPMYGKGDEQKGSKNPSWKGNKPQYQTLHAWLYKNKTKPKFCEHCNLKFPHDVALKKGKTYTRNFTNYLWLCRNCHVKYDRHGGDRNGIYCEQ